jgi:hypothetical protein
VVFSLFAENDKDLKTVQSLMRYANQQRHHEYLHPRCQQPEAAGAEQSGGNDSGQSKAAESAGISKCVFSYVWRRFSKSRLTLFGMNGGDDETRTRTAIAGFALTPEGNRG